MRELPPTAPTSQTTPGKLSKRRLVFENFRNDFWAEVGDTVYFKNVPKKRRVAWEVLHIETDYQKCRWTKGGNPNFIHLQRKDKPTMTVWTCSNQLSNYGFQPRK